MNGSVPRGLFGLPIITAYGDAASRETQHSIVKLAPTDMACVNATPAAPENFSTDCCIGGARAWGVNVASALNPAPPELTVRGLVASAAPPLRADDAKTYRVRPTSWGVLKRTVQLMFALHSKFAGVV